MKLEKTPTLADSFCDLRTRKIKTTFFTQINTLLGWEILFRGINSVIRITSNYCKFNGGLARQSRIEKMHTQNLMEIFCCLYKSL